MMTRIISTACCRLTARASSRGAVPNTWVTAGRFRSGCLIQSRNAAIAACATSPSQDRFSADMLRNHGSGLSMAAIAAVPSAPVARSIRLTVSALTRGPSARPPARPGRCTLPDQPAYDSASLTGRSRRYRSMAWAGNPASTAPVRASSHSTARVIDSASTWKNRRAAGRVSEKPNPSVPSEVNVPGTQRAIWSGTALIQSDTATSGPGRPASSEVTYGSRGGSDGCSMFHDSQASASRRSSVQDVADHTSADTPQSRASISWAASADRSATPEARIWARGTGTTLRSEEVEEPAARPASQSRTAGAESEPPSGEAPSAGAYRYRPRRMPCSSPAVPPGNEAGSGGCGYGSLYRVR